MHIELNSTDLCCMKGPSSLIIRNLADMSSQFDIGGDILRAGSVLEASELVMELVPTVHLQYIRKFMPQNIVDRAIGSVTREQRAIIDLAGRDIPQEWGGKFGKSGCPWAFVISRGIWSVCCDLERFTSRSYETVNMAPGAGEWTIWDGCASEWSRIHSELPYGLDLDEELARRLKRVVDTGVLMGSRPMAASIYINLFAWQVEVSPH